MTRTQGIEDTEIPSFELARELRGHSQDVKAVAAPTPALLLSASRDGSIRQWSLDSNGDTDTDGDEAEVYSSSTASFVNCIACILPSSDFPGGLVVAGGTDCAVSVFAPGSHEPIYVLVGHSHNVCSLDVDTAGAIVTARIWINWQSHAILQGHTQAVWAVLIWNDSSTILTGSADKTIRMWSNAATIKTYEGHTDCVRALCKLADDRFASCGNDSAIRIWHIDGSQLRQLYGHTSFIYSLALLPSGEIVSSGEDRSVRIWRNHELIQTITIPAVSVWSVACSPLGDIVCGASDGVVRVFTRDSTRRAPIQVLKAFEDTVAAQAIPSTQVGDINKENLPGLEALQNPGNKEAQVIMIRNGETVEAYQWTAGSWQKIGEVVDAVGSGRKQIYDGKEYDYVFDVDIQEGAPPLKLPYNANENPWSAANRFLEQNDLDMGFLEQVADFVVKNTKGVNLGVAEDFNSQYGSRYKPGQKDEDRPSVFPQRTYLSFKQINLEGIKKKVRDLNNTVGTASLTSKELEHLDSICILLENSQEIDDTGIQVILKIATSWPIASRFPGLDLLRIVVLPDLYHKDQGDTNLMLGLRSLVNFFSSKDGRNLLVDRIEMLLSLVSLVSSQNKNVRLARATSYLNLVTLIHESSKEYLREQIVDVVEKASRSESDPETVYRLLIALGTALSVPKPTREMKQTALKLVLQYQTLSMEKRITNAIEDIRLLIA
ncbi:Ubiquitin homeostasis protein lub1 [Neolecta irregularis DAH-3]|uniref:Ubiquitin homeostasis protein lub1 n=1 Tax=Neolecta irregularis (strain DAH-3) TaxID=1198029 RepID=A0A1U7LH50_NEOID|nr:Ubiquitin homeostasis protein lub1 [Neolecta irregularis DAH-3]|eukprot:OLL21923.1 Ubiquitin homeostasis protein lub1 [Neolecta irregularis DAH-3]